MLHVTHGDAAADALRAAGFQPVLPWRDVLHEGPVPAALSLQALSAERARFIAAQGWGRADTVAAEFAARDGALAAAADEDEVVLWFEHDLYDQLQLLQLLDWFSGHPARRLTLVGAGEYLGPAPPQRIAALFAGRAPVTRAQLALGRGAWAAFRAETPEPLERLLRGETAPLPHLAAAVRRLLEQLPGADDGVSRSERMVLTALLRGEHGAGALFRLHNAQEAPVWLGDLSFFGYLEALAAAPHPLVDLSGCEGAGAGRVSWAGCRVTLTDLGRAVATGGADAVEVHGIDRWLGGIRLHGTGPVWRWDRASERSLRR